MTIANSFDLWKKDAFFSAAEDVQESADMHKSDRAALHQGRRRVGKTKVAKLPLWLVKATTGPFIVAAGGISNIFLHRLAENIQDAYAEAASIAEQ
ncbi:hypothetical protein Gotur_027808, partial [Gossypium turneri]